MVPHDTSGPSLSNILSYLVSNASQEPGFEHASVTSHPASESGSSSNGDPPPGSTSLESGIANRFPGLVFLNYDTANRGPLGPPGTFWMYAWHVDEVQRFSQPVPAGQKSQTGYRTPRRESYSFVYRTRLEGLSQQLQYHEKSHTHISAAWECIYTLFSGFAHAADPY